jgi:hypothetical protein
LADASYWDTAPARFLLSPAYHQVAEILGWDRAVEIGYLVWEKKCAPSRHRKGVGRVGALYVPGNVEPHSAIVKLIGLDDARRLSAAFGGEQLCFPSLEAASIPSRNKAIRERATDGFRPEEIGATFDLTARQVRRICRAA